MAFSLLTFTGTAHASPPSTFLCIRNLAERPTLLPPPFQHPLLGKLSQFQRLISRERSAALPPLGHSEATAELLICPISVWLYQGKGRLDERERGRAGHSDRAEDTWTACHLDMGRVRSPRTIATVTSSISQHTSERITTQTFEIL